MADDSEQKKRVAGGEGITTGGDVSFGNITGQVAIGNFINQFKIEKPSGDELFKLIDLLEQKRKEEFNKEILNQYIPSEIPDYPLKLREFVTHNRADDITKTLTYIQDHRILLISGIGGVGKTTLARALIETRPANVPLPFWFDFNINMNAALGDVLEKLAGYLKDPRIAGFRAERREAGQDDINRLAGELQRREQLWLVFDNLETILDDRYFHDEGMDKLFTSLRGRTHNAKIIFTSRVIPELKNGNELIGVLEKIRELEGLSITHAVYYLVKKGFGGVDKDILEKIAKDVDGHPFALELLVGIANDMGVGIALNEIELYRKQKLTKIKIQKKLFEKLAGVEKEFLERMSVFRKPEPISALKIMFTHGTSVEDVRKLKRKSLLKIDKNDNFWLHPLIREFSYDDLKDKKKIHYLACLYYISLKLPDELTKKGDVKSLIEACHHACMSGKYDEAVGMIFDLKLHEDLDRWGEYRTLIELYSGLLPEDHFSHNILLSDKKTHSAVLGNLGNAYRNLGQVEKAIEHHQKELAISQEIRDRRMEGNAMGNLASAYYSLGQVEKAIEHHQKALAISQEIGDRRMEGNAMGNLASEYYSLGQIEKAIEHYQKVLTISQEIGDRRMEGNTMGNLGSGYYFLGQVEKAIEHHQKALAISQEIGERRMEGNAMGNLGSAYSNLGQVEKAIEHHQKALAISQEIGDRRNEGNCLGNLGLEYYSLGQVEKAIEHYQKALTISQEIGDRSGEGAHVSNLGSAYYSLGQVEKAIEHHQKALAISQEIGDRRNEGNCLGNLGSAYYSLGQVEKAIEHYQKALTISQEIGERRMQGNHLNNLGSAFANKKKYRVALACYLLSKEIRIEIKDPNLETTELNLSNLKEALGENEFEKLIKEVEPAAEEIVKDMLK
jgi:tetratricopeptide (TPR) repeat protein